MNERSMGMLPPSIAQDIRRQVQDMLVSGQRFTMYDRIRQRHFWSMAFFAIDGDGYIPAMTQSLFITPPGQNGQGFPAGIALGPRESNWPGANRVPDNQNIEATELGVSILPVVAAPDGEIVLAPSAVWPRVQSDFLNNTVLNIKYLTNSVPLGLAADFAQASGLTNGLYSPVNTIEAAEEPVGINKLFSISTNGFSAPGLRRRFKIPILLQHGETFSFELQIPRAFYTSIEAEATMEFHGILARMDMWATESFVEKS